MNYKTIALDDLQNDRYEIMKFIKLVVNMQAADVVSDFRVDATHAQELLLQEIGYEPNSIILALIHNVPMRSTKDLLNLNLFYNTKMINDEERSVPLNCISYNQFADSTWVTASCDLNAINREQYFIITINGLSVDQIYDKLIEWIENSEDFLWIET